jgi:hypothetical protein
VNAFASGNLSVALLRLEEAYGQLGRVGALHDVESCKRAWDAVDQAKWAVREAMRLIENACAVDDMESVDTLPSPPDSGERRLG